MKISRVEIRNFRSILRLDLTPTRSSIICGPNSCGKSNVLRALKFALLPRYDAERAAANFCNAVPGPNASVMVRIDFDSPTIALHHALNLPGNQTFRYEFKIKRNGVPAR